MLLDSATDCMRIHVDASLCQLSRVSSALLPHVFNPVRRHSPAKQRFTSVTSRLLVCLWVCTGVFENHTNSIKNHEHHLQVLKITHCINIRKSINCLYGFCCSLPEPAFRQHGGLRLSCGMVHFAFHAPSYGYPYCRDIRIIGIAPL